MKRSLRAANSEPRLDCWTRWLFANIVFVAFGSPMALAQGTAFVYQGRLTDGGSPANANYEMQFKLYDTAAVGSGLLQGGPITRDPVAVLAGNFSVTLDFGLNAFPGTDRYLEIGVRPDGSAAAFTVLSQRQQIMASPYAIQTINAQQLGGLVASRYLASAANGFFGIAVQNPTLGRLQVEGATANAIYGHSNNGVGVYGSSTLYEGVRGEAADVNHGAVVGVHSGAGIGVFGTSTGAGVQGSSAAGKGVVGTSTTGTGVYGTTGGTGTSTAGV
jgi:hypothetical protein